MKPLLAKDLRGGVENVISGHQLSFPTER